MITYNSKVRILKGFYAGHEGIVKDRQPGISSWMYEQPALYRIILDDGHETWVDVAYVYLIEQGGRNVPNNL